ncbi:MAG TPA: hypothetical protein VFZ93_08085 [Albitalea sp.]
MKTATLDKLVWTLVYGGLLALVIGLSVQRTDAALGWTLAGAGGAFALAGAALVVVRARMKDPPTEGDRR